MGIGRAGDGTVGIAAVSSPAALRLAGAALAAGLLAGCQSGGGLAGAVTGTTTAAATGNPALGAAVGIGTRAVADAAIRGVSRRWHRTEQDALAAEVGRMEAGETRSWRSRHFLPVGNAEGEVKVLGVVDTPLTTCKEVLFTTAGAGAGGPPPRWFVTTACRQAGGWKWAAAEPATGRWDGLQ